MPLPVIAGAVSSALMTVAADQGVRGLMQTVLQATKNGVEIFLCLISKIPIVPFFLTPRKPI
ncbi:hypothetical protein [Pseudomonas phage vB_PA32_GUMS]|nr:hypothetical protein [Pseudomonas phage vB_PA32_GUMS]